MPEEGRTRRFAILIDADNTSPRIAAGLFEEVAKFGEASVRRIYESLRSSDLALAGRRRVRPVWPGTVDKHPLAR